MKNNKKEEEEEGSPMKQEHKVVTIVLLIVVNVFVFSSNLGASKTTFYEDDELAAPKRPFPRLKPHTTNRSTKVGRPLTFDYRKNSSSNASKKTINIKVDFFRYQPTNDKPFWPFYNLLKDKYNINYTNNPDFLFYTARGEGVEHFTKMHQNIYVRGELSPQLQQM